MKMATNLATYNILIHTQSDRENDQGLLFRSLKTLSVQGIINGMKPLSLVEGEDYWSLFYTCSCSKNAIEEMLLPIHQCFFIHKLSDNNLFDESEGVHS